MRYLFMNITVKNMKLTPWLHLVYCRGLFQFTPMNLHRILLSFSNIVINDKCLPLSSN